MPILTATHYSAFLYPNSTTGNVARINIYCNDHKLYIIFRDISPMPANSFDPVSKTGSTCEHISRYQNYIDLLRNEKPISVTFVTDVNPPNFVVYCASEAVGETE